MPHFLPGKQNQESLVPADALLALLQETWVWDRNALQCKHSGESPPTPSVWMTG